MQQSDNDVQQNKRNISLTDPLSVVSKFQTNQRL